MSLGAPELLIIVGTMVLGILPFAFCIFGLVDASSTPDWVWLRAGQNKTLWIVLLAIGLLFCGFGLVVAIIYFASIRGSLKRAGESGVPT
jgi:hypothetical protein